MSTYTHNKINQVSQPQFQAWTDQHGMMTDNDYGGGTGNGQLYTAHYAFGLAENGLLTQEEKDRIIQVFSNNLREPGLFNRLPQADGWYQAHDDLLGLLGGEAILFPDRKDRVLSKQMLKYGQKTHITGVDPTEKDPRNTKQNETVYPIVKAISYLNPLSFGKVRYVWNNVNPGKFHVSSWIGRRMEVIASMQMGAGGIVNPIYWLYWAGTMLLNTWKPNTNYHDGYILRFYSALACQGYGPLTNLVCKTVRKQVQKDFGGLGELLCAYFGKPHHPIVALCKGKY